MLRQSTLDEFFRAGGSKSKNEVARESGKNPKVKAKQEQLEDKPMPESWSLDPNNHEKRLVFTVYQTPGWSSDFWSEATLYQRVKHPNYRVSRKLITSKDMKLFVRDLFNDWETFAIRLQSNNSLITNMGRIPKEFKSACAIGDYVYILSTKTLYEHGEVEKAAQAQEEVGRGLEGELEG